MHYRFTVGQSWTELTGYSYSNTATYYSAQNIPLLVDAFIVNGTSNSVVGDIIVDKCIITITFNIEGTSGNFGDIGWYHFNTVLSYPDGTIEEAIVNDGDYWQYFVPGAGVTVAGLNNGVAYEEEITAIGFALNTSYVDLEMLYEIAVNGTGVLVYSFNDDTWHRVEADLTDEGMELTTTTVRYLHFTDLPLADSLVSDNASLAVATYNWIKSNSTYYSSNPLQTVVNSDGVTYSFTDGDGGMYINYYVDAVNNVQYSSALDSYFSYARSLGGGDGFIDVNFSTWIANAVTGFFDVELFPGFSLGGIFAIIISILIAVVFLKLFAGG